MDHGAKLTLDGLGAGYGPAEVVRGIDLEVVEGRINAVFGPNGAGKSTACKAIAGLIPVSRGRIIYKGSDISDRPSWWRARKGIILIPEGRGVFPSLSVDDNLRILLPKVQDRATIYEQFGQLADRRLLRAGNLSGGEQQLLSLAPSLIHRAELLIADEPTLGLAPLVAELVLGIFSELCQRGTTVLLVGESPRGIVEIAERVSLLHAGRITWSGSSVHLEQEKILDSYFGSSAFA
jgi:ABC-type branched-subunit amino acid transport system ATPase component